MVILWAPTWLTETRSRELSPCSAFSSRRRTRRCFSAGNTHSSEPARFRRAVPRKPVNTNRFAFLSLQVDMQVAVTKKDLVRLSSAPEPESPQPQSVAGAKERSRSLPRGHGAVARRARSPLPAFDRKGPSAALVPKSAPNDRKPSTDAHVKDVPNLDGSRGCVSASLSASVRRRRRAPTRATRRTSRLGFARRTVRTGGYPSRPLVRRVSGCVRVRKR
jgi:hypothetical protein